MNNTLPLLLRWGIIFNYVIFIYNIKTKLVEGAITEIDDPSPDVYQQILDDLAEMRELFESASLPINDQTADYNSLENQ